MAAVLFDKADMISILHKKPEHVNAIRVVLEQAFGQSDEADLVDALRRRGAAGLRGPGSTYLPGSFNPDARESGDE